MNKLARYPYGIEYDDDYSSFMDWVRRHHKLCFVMLIAVNLWWVWRGR